MSSTKNTSALNARDGFTRPWTRPPPSGSRLGSGSEAADHLWTKTSLCFTFGKKGVFPIIIPEFWDKKGSDFAQKLHGKIHGF